LLKRARNLRVIISGHWHPPGQPFFLHFGDTFEVVGMAMFKTPDVGLVTFDNNRAAYHVITVGREEFAVMTHPCPLNQTSGLDVFNERETEVRALVFTDRQVNLSVSGPISGRLMRVRKLKEGVFLYSLPMVLEPGIYEMKKEGDWSGTVRFVVGDSVDSFWEIPYIMEASTAWTVVFVVALVPALYLALPNAVTRNRDCPVLVGCVNVKIRLCQLPWNFRLVLFASVMACVIVPVAFYPIEDTVGALHVFGQITAAGFQWHYIGAEFGLSFLFGMFYPLVNLVNGMIGYPREPSLWVDVGYFVVGICEYCRKFARLLDMFGVFYTLTSPLMVLVPVVLYGTLAQWLWETRRSRGGHQGDARQLIESAMYKIEA
jgi:hypothetical protein